MIDVQKLARDADPFGEEPRLFFVAATTPETLERFAALVLEEAAKEFDRRMVLDKHRLAVGFYEPEEPARIIRSLKPKGEA
jgi:hypothetical protein